MAEEVRKWLEEAAIGQYADQFIAEGYECMALVEELDDQDVQELAEVMQMPRGHAKKLQNQIRRLRGAEAAASADATVDHEDCEQVRIVRRVVSL
jgi:hypothetical protein